jgi:EAL domain-containing protein (putative c-di-GMP-specific phosphodiesterase class I)
MSQHAARSTDATGATLVRPLGIGEAPARVLVVDDEALVLRSLQRLLEHAGYDVVVASDGLRGAALAAGGGFDVILSDIAMPGLDGLGLLRKVRETDADVPIILLTGQPDDARARLAVEHGALMYLVKPVDVRSLGQLLAHAVELHRFARIKRAAFEHIGGVGDRSGDLATIAARFERALPLVWMAFQPIVRWTDRSVIGYEALVRSDEPSLATAGEIIGAAERLARTRDLGALIRARIAEAVPAAPPTARIHVNLHPHDLVDEALYSSHNPLRALAPRVVLEVTERETLEEVPELSERVDALRAAGFRIAVDDLGSGYAGLDAFAKLRPSVVKLDMALVRGVDGDPVRYSVVRAMASLCQEIGVEVVAEGVETEAERRTLGEIGCEYQQGFAYARPQREFVTP